MRLRAQGCVLHSEYIKMVIGCTIGFATRSGLVHGLGHLQWLAEAMKADLEMYLPSGANLAKNGVKYGLRKLL